MTNDNSAFFAIIAINMTVIGLTSLAETKNIIGVDYGKFLVRSYKVFNTIRIYYLLILFALINVVSLIFLFTENETYRVNNIKILLVSLIFAIYYFFAYVIVENRFVKQQIYAQELLGLYYDSDQVTNFEADLIAKMSNGSRTEKKLSSNVITYFNAFNNESQKAFEEVFGPASIIYKNSRRIKRFWKKKVGKTNYNYVNVDGHSHISHEFFQLYRYSDLQEKWLLEILRLFNGSYTIDYQEMRLNNILRILAHINRFGYVENLYKYKFLEYLTPYIMEGLDLGKEKKYDKNHRSDQEKFAIKQLCKYIFFSVSKYEDKIFFNTAINTLNQVINNEEYHGILQINDRLIILLEEACHYDHPMIKELVTCIYNNYWEVEIKNKLVIQQVKAIMNNRKDSNTCVKYQVEDIF